MWAWPTVFLLSSLQPPEARQPWEGGQVIIMLPQSTSSTNLTPSPSCASYSRCGYTWGCKRHPSGDLKPTDTAHLMQTNGQALWFLFFFSPPNYRIASYPPLLPQYYMVVSISLLLHYMSHICYWSGANYLILLGTSIQRSDNLHQVCGTST